MAGTNGRKIGAKAEWHRARTVLVHPSGVESEIMALHHPSALFENAPDIEKAQEQHPDFAKHLERVHGIEVIHVREILENQTDLGRLRDLAFRQLEYDFVGHDREGGELSAEADKVKRKVINACGRRRLVDIIMLNPLVKWDGYDQDGRTREAIRIFRPLGNLLFTRDQMITTDKGVVLSRMREPQRSREVEIMKVVLETIGIEPIYQVEDKGGEEDFLEGGDYFSMGDFCLLGVGHRTGYSGARQLIENNVFGFDEVVLVRDGDSKLEEMHLDTYFNVLDRGAVALLGDKDSTAGPAPNVEVWRRQDGGYVQDPSQKGRPLDSFMRDRGFTVVTLPRKMQRRYGLNFLNIGGNGIVGVPLDELGVSRRKGGFMDRVATEYTKSGRTPLKLPEWNTVPFRGVNDMYGGHHCTTQVLHREE